MDTISCKLIFFTEAVNDFNQLQHLVQHLNQIRSEYGHTYLDVLEYDTQGIVIKISYPRYYAGHNAFLITARSQCIRVQSYFIRTLQELQYLQFFSQISLLRVDIPFTYIMPYCAFHSYENIFRIFAEIYYRQFPKASPREIRDIRFQKTETIYYTNTRSISNYNSKVMIYDQNANLEEKMESSIYQGILEQFPDLSLRIRLEVSKRIRRQPISIENFSTWDIFGEYFDSYKEYLLKNLLNLQLLEEVYDTQAQQLAQQLSFARENKGFIYEGFLLEHIRDIWDYEILRRSLKYVFSNQNTLENAVTTIRRILRAYEEKNQIMILTVYSEIQKIYACICQYQLLD